jgi:hypothetical protein
VSLLRRREGAPDTPPKLDAPSSQKQAFSLRRMPGSIPDYIWLGHQVAGKAERLLRKKADIYTLAVPCQDALQPQFQIGKASRSSQGG